MDKEIIEKIGRSKNVKDLKLFVAFLSERFPEESNIITSYFEEWADRFNSKAPEGYMDGKSLKIYFRLLGEKK